MCIYYSGVFPPSTEELLLSDLHIMENQREKSILNCGLLYMFHRATLIDIDDSHVPDRM